MYNDLQRVDAEPQGFCPKSELPGDFDKLFWGRFVGESQVDEVVKAELNAGKTRSCGGVKTELERVASAGKAETLRGQYENCHRGRQKASAQDDEGERPAVMTRGREQGEREDHPAWGRHKIVAGRQTPG
jgi:hypothetical protein